MRAVKKNVKPFATGLTKDISEPLRRQKNTREPSWLTRKGTTYLHLEKRYATSERAQIGRAHV